MSPVTRKAIQAGITANVWLYRRTNGRVGGRGMGCPPLLLLTVPGRRSGTPHTVPIAHLDHNGGYLVVGTGMARSGAGGRGRWRHGLCLVVMSDRRLGLPLRCCARVRRAGAQWPAGWARRGRGSRTAS